MLLQERNRSAHWWLFFLFYISILQAWGCAYNSPQLEVWCFICASAGWVYKCHQWVCSEGCSWSRQGLWCDKVTRSGCRLPESRGCFGGQDYRARGLNCCFLVVPDGQVPREACWDTYNFIEWILWQFLLRLKLLIQPTISGVGYNLQITILGGVRFF